MNIIIWDLGGTKCAAALMTSDSIKKSCHIKLNSVNSLEELILTIEQELEIKHSDVDAICIGAAGIYNGKILQLANGYPYEMPFGELSEKYQWAPFEIIHDYALIICATFTDKINYKKLNHAEPDEFGRRVTLGVGTGLGLKDGVLFPDGNFWLGSNEMGHIGIKDSLTFEDILSGRGLAKLRESLSSEDALKSFAYYLGSFVATVQLSFMPSGGIWITGGVIQSHNTIFDYPEFTQGIESLPAYLPKRKTFPLYVLENDHHAFWGGAYYAMKKICCS
jgi:glucokinase